MADPYLIKCDEYVKRGGTSSSTATDKDGDAAEKEAIKDANEGALDECGQAAAYRCPGKECSEMLIQMDLGKPEVSRKNIKNEDQEIIAQKVKARVEWTLTIECIDQEEEAPQPRGKAENDKGDELECTQFFHKAGPGVAGSGGGDSEKAARAAARKNTQKTAIGNALRDYQKHLKSCPKTCPKARFKLLLKTTVDAPKKEGANKYSCEATCTWQYWVECSK